MKIATVVFQYARSGGGVERASNDLITGLVKMGHEVHVFAHKFKGTIVSKNIVAHKVPAITFLSALKHLTFASNVKKELEEDSFDIIQSFSRTYYQDVYVVGGGSHWRYIENTNRNTSSKLGRFLIRANPRQSAILHVEKKSFQPGSYKKIVCVSKGIKDEIVKDFNLPEQNISVIYNGVDINLFNPKNKELFRTRLRNSFSIKDDEMVLLFVGNGFERKGLAYAIESLTLLSKEWKVKLLIVGKGKFAYYRSLAGKFRLRDRIFFLGERDNIEEYYAMADAVILPTLYDPFALVCLEAMATAVPVITTKVAGVSEIITDGKDSFVVESGEDVVEIANKTKQLYNKKFRDEMGIQARVTAENFSLEKYVNSYLQIYDEVLKMKQAGVKV